jgi:hypothetical protein
MFRPSLVRSVARAEKEGTFSKEMQGIMHADPPGKSLTPSAKVAIAEIRSSLSTSPDWRRRKVSARMQIRSV